MMDNWIKKDLKHIWHPYTQMKECAKYPPILIEKAKGIKLYDNKGNFYYDTISSWWCNVHGHNHPRITAAIKEQLDSLDHVLLAGFTHKPAIRLAEKLIALAPGKLSRVFYSDNGSTAVEVALKLSFQYWRNVGREKKNKFVSLSMGYHGDTIGTMSVSGIDLFNKTFASLFFSSLKAPSPYCYRCPIGKNIDTCNTDCVIPLEKILKEHSRAISAIILEPLLLAAGGMVVYPKRYLQEAARLAKKFDVHLIIDEVATGFGRTGKFFSVEHAGIEPDFMCLSKGITAGYLPLAATLTTERIYRAFYADFSRNKTFYHGHTYTANPISCSAALASLEVFKEEKTLEEMQKKIPLFHGLMERFRALPFVGDVRYIGFVAAAELVKDKKSKKPFGLRERVGLKVYEKALKEQLILRPLGNIVYFFLPLCVKEKEIKEVVNRAYSVIDSL